MSRSSDIHYGRRGGRIVPAGQTGEHPPCKLCGKPMMAGQTVAHGVCLELEADRTATERPD